MNPRYYWKSIREDDTIDSINPSIYDYETDDLIFLNFINGFSSKNEAIERLKLFRDKFSNYQFILMEIY